MGLKQNLFDGFSLPTTDELELKARRFVQRAANFLKPRQVSMPVSVEQILSSRQGLDTVEQFSDLWYRSGVPGELSWKGDPVVKNPCDLWMIVELFQSLRPAAIVETGTHHGGSASFYADILGALGIEAIVVTVDINPKWAFNPKSKRITSITGYSTDSAVVSKVADAVGQAEGPVMVILDSDHTAANVKQELDLYSRFVTLGSYLIVEDTNVNGHPSSPDFGPGPWEAVEGFLRSRSDFIPDRQCERFLLTFNPRGWLKRVA
jgi:cephalosporin hydroxylase